MVWRDHDRVREQYRRSLDYVLRDGRRASPRAAPREPPLIVVLGDHQPAAFVSGDAAGRDVPMHVIGAPGRRSRCLDGWGWSDGPGPGAGRAGLADGGVPRPLPRGLLGTATTRGRTAMP